jgi:hypothetical protein
MALSRAQKKLLAIRRAERRLLNRLADIDWEYDVLLKEIEQMKGLEQNEAIEIGVESVQTDDL